MTKENKIEEMEERLEDELGFIHTVDCYHTCKATCNFPIIRQFIKSEIAQARKEEREKMINKIPPEEAVDPIKEWRDGNFADRCWHENKCGFNRCRKTILEALSPDN